MLPNYVKQENAPASTANFAKLNQYLAMEFRHVAKVWNSRAERPLWQSRFFLIHHGEAIFIDLLDSSKPTKPIQAVVHNRAWEQEVSPSTLSHIYEVLSRAEAPFFISKGGL